jgi:lipoic acid synthetase
MDDLREAGCEVLTLGQYLQPTLGHMPVVAYIHPDQFGLYREKALERGFREVESSPLVRSSYHAEKHVKKT